MSFKHRQPPITFALASRSTLFFIGQATATVVFAPLLLVAVLLPYRLRFAIVLRWTYFIIWWLRVTCGLGHVVEGRDNIPDKPAIVLSNHQSAWETIALQYYFAPQVWVLKRELLLVPFFGWGLAMLRPIAIDRRAGKDAITQILEQGNRRLENGCWVVVFPEGTRVPPGGKRRYKLGGAKLAAETGAQVVPVAHNAGLYWPRNSFIKYPGTITLVIGPPIDSRGKSAAEINALAEAWIEPTAVRLLAAAETEDAAAVETEIPKPEGMEKTC